MTFHARLTELLEKNKQGDIADGLKLSSFLFNHAEAIRDLVRDMESIARNTCCDKCQEAALVAKQALAKLDES